MENIEAVKAAVSCGTDSEKKDAGGPRWCSTAQSYWACTSTSGAVISTDRIRSEVAPVCDVDVEKFRRVFTSELGLYMLGKNGTRDWR
jgi:hypothetical protein